MCSLAKAGGEPPLCFLRVQQEAKEEAKGGRVEALQQEQTANVSTRSSRPRAADRGGRRMVERGQRKATTETAAAWNLEDAEFYTAKVGTTSIRAKAFGEKNRGRSVILRVGGARAVCSVHRPPERVERVERAAPAPLCVAYGGRVEATHNRKQTTRRPLCNDYTRQNKRPPLRKEQPKAKNRTFENSNT